MAHASSYKPDTAVEKWLDDRLPIMRMMHDQFNDFPTPRNLNYLWTFGGILTFFLVVQILTGVVLAMHYVPQESMAFDSVEHIMRDVNWGWLIRYMHSTVSLCHADDVEATIQLLVRFLEHAHELGPAAGAGG